MAESFSLYLVTDRHRTGGRPLLDVVEAALRGGVDAVQLREKDLTGGALFELAGQLRELTHRHGARLLINDRVDIALGVGADGVHLPVDSFTPTDARRLLPKGALIGASTHCLEQARVAAGGGADFIVFGPIFDTPSKRTFGAPVGLDALTQVTRTVILPTLAIGGLTVDRVPTVRACGVSGIAVVAAILEADDPRAAAAALRNALA